MFLFYFFDLLYFFECCKICDVQMYIECVCFQINFEVDFLRISTSRKDGNMFGENKSTVLANVYWCRKSRPDCLCDTRRSVLMIFFSFLRQQSQVRAPVHCKQGLLPA